MPWTKALRKEKITPSTGWVLKTVNGVSFSAEWWTLWKAQRNGYLCIHRCTMYFEKSSNKKRKVVKEAITVVAAKWLPNFVGFQSKELNALKIAVAITSWVINSGEIKNMKILFKKNTFASAKDERDKNIDGSNIFNMAAWKDNFFRHTSQINAMPNALSKYPKKMRFLGSKKLARKIS